MIIRLENKLWRRAAALTGLAALVSVTSLLEGVREVCAQQVSIRHYNVSDGLAHSQVTAILQDRKGYMWFGTFEGLSRFDGYRFTNYSTGDGLGHILINHLAEDKQGRLWVATNGGGVARLIDDPRDINPAAGQRRKFVTYRLNGSAIANNVNKVIFDSNNRLWCLTDDGVYRTTVDGDPKDLIFDLVMASHPFLAYTAFEDGEGRIWFGIGRELIEIVQGAENKYGSGDPVGAYEITGIAQDARGHMFVANRRELFVFAEPVEDVKGRGNWTRLPILLAPGEEIFSMIADADAGLWLGTSKGLVRYRDGQQKRYSIERGLVGNPGRVLAQDREGNLWVSTNNGIYLLGSKKIVTFTEAEGLPDPSVLKVLEDQDGRVYAVTNGRGIVEIRDGRLSLLSGSQRHPYSDVQDVLIDRRSGWWLKTNNRLLRVQGPRPDFRGHNGAIEGFSRSRGQLTIGLHEDEAGRVWISGYEGETNVIYEFDPHSAQTSPVPIKLDSDREISPVIGIQSDRSGALWLATHAQLGRMRNGRVTFLEPTEGLPETYPRALFSDSRGWLWIGLRFGGLSLTRDPGADQPTFTNYSTRDGLASNSVFSIAEDDVGRIYVGTGRGLDQLDPATGRIRHFGPADGLAGTRVTHCIRDRSGNIWIATSTGLSHLNPRAEHDANYLPPVYLSRIQVAGEDLSLPETGALEVPNLELTASRNNLLIEYIGVSFQTEGTLRYQYKLESTNQDWSTPSRETSVNYARLSPGSYRFAVRAVSPDGKASAQPAVIHFRILPPLWQRWWFVTLAAMVAAIAAYSLYRRRVARLVELERVRTRIATDLHDDIGANLSRIAILSEVAAQRVNESRPEAIEPLSMIAATSRDLLDSMSDIVWAINPNKDHIGDLAQRMRRFASDVFTARNIQFHFRAPSAEAYHKVSADVRRQVFLIFKESVNNAVRHSACTEVQLDLRLEAGLLTMILTDNGRGFDLAEVTQGNGLDNLRSRALSLGGKLEIASKCGKGTTVALRVTLVATAKPTDTRLHGG